MNATFTEVLNEIVSTFTHEDGYQYPIIPNKTSMVVEVYTLTRSVTPWRVGNIIRICDKFEITFIIEYDTDKGSQTIRFVL